MAKITLNTFGGIFPKISPRLIPANAGTIAEYCRLDSGRLSAWGANANAPDHHGVSPFQVPLTTKTIYRHRNRDGSAYWLKWDAEVHAIPSPIRQDQWDRLYWTGDVYPRFSLGTEVSASTAPGYVPNVTHRLGVPAPASSPAIDSVDALGDTTVAQLYRAYSYTFVSGLGEEGPPSPPSTVIQARQGDHVHLSFADGGFPGAVYNTGPNPGLRRVYRTDTAGDFLFLADVPLTTTTFVDTLLDEQLGEILGSTDYDTPPDETVATHPDGPLQMLTQMPNGIVAGYSGRTLCFSEAYLPHTFPVNYQLTTRYRITGIVAISIGLVILTEGKPALATGNSPASMTLQELDDANSCVSRRSIVDMGEMAIFASPTGLVAATQNGMQNITLSLFSNHQWAALNPSSIHAYRYDGRYMFFYDNGTTAGGYMIDFTGQEPQLVTLPFHAICGFYEPIGGALYLAIPDGTGSATVMQFDAGDPTLFRWQSREIRVEAPINPGCAIVDAQGYPITFKLFADGAQVWQQVVADSEMFRLPDGYRGKDFTVYVEGLHDINAVHVGETPQDLAQ